MLKKMPPLKYALNRKCLLYDTKNGKIFGKLTNLLISSEIGADSLLLPEIMINKGKYYLLPDTIGYF